jgi:hypothetical protein
MIRDGLGVIAGARGDDASGLLICGQVEHPVQSAAILERSRTLKTFQLDVQLRGQLILETSGAHKRSYDNRIANPLARTAYVSEARHLNRVWTSSSKFVKPESSRV